MTDIAAVLQLIADDIAAIGAIVNPTPPIVASPPVVPKSGEPPLSPMEIAAGLTHTVFFDGFDIPSTIDWKSEYTMANEMAWASPYGDTSGISMANSIMHIAHDPNDGGGNCLNTYCCAGSDPTNISKHPWVGPIRGWGFKGSASISVSIACDPSKSTSPLKTWPAAWSLALEAWQAGLEQDQGKSCALPGGSSPEHVEFDFVEIGFPSASSILMSLAFWRCDTKNSRPYPSCDWNGIFLGNNRDTAVPPGFDVTKQNVYTTVYLSAVDNGGSGSVKRYINGTHIPECDVNWKTGDGSPWEKMDHQTHGLILGAGVRFPADFDFICVRQKQVASA